MSHIKLLLLLASLSCLSLYCKKEEPQKEEDKLPPLTTEGKQTFGCLMNGKAWPDRYDIDFGSSGYANGVFELYLRTQYPNSTAIYEEISIYVDHKIFGPGHYVIPVQESGYSHNFIVDYNNKWYNSYFTPNGYVVMDIIRLDTINHVMSGMFDLSLYGPFESNPINVTKGRFDYKYLP